MPPPRFRCSREQSEDTSSSQSPYLDRTSSTTSCFKSLPRATAQSLLVCTHVRQRDQSKRHPHRPRQLDPLKITSFPSVLVMCTPELIHPFPARAHAQGCQVKLGASSGPPSLSQLVSRSIKLTLYNPRLQSSDHASHVPIRRPVLCARVRAFSIRFAFPLLNSGRAVDSHRRFARRSRCL